MKIRITINGRHHVTGEVQGKGYLGAHIILDDKGGEGNPAMDIALSGYDTNNPKETKYLKWLPSVLKSGDHIGIDLMPEGTADNPVEIKSSLKDKRSISTSEQQAERILAVAYSCNRLLEDLLHNLKPELPTEEYKKLAYGVGSVIDEVFSAIAEPVYRMHPSMVPEALKDMPL